MNSSQAEPLPSFVTVMILLEKVRSLEEDVSRETWRDRN